ncbi:MAG: hypothetical protein ACHQ3O_07405 [Candidatus Limnocylindria bacterium]|jgi:hypothetical protein
MLRKTLAVLAGILGLALVIVATQYVASESGEVVVLRTRDAAGAFHETRLWVVDHDGSAWLRAGNPSGGWFPRLSADPGVLLVRGSETLAFQAVPTPEARDTINDLMQAKYGWADSYISFFFPRAKKIPVRLVPATPKS